MSEIKCTNCDEINEYLDEITRIIDQRDELWTALKIIAGASKNASKFYDLQVIAKRAIEKCEATK